jgi:hypothetical protein
MIKNLKYYTSLLLCVGLVSISCTESIDLEQAKDLVLTPALEASLVHFDEPASQFAGTSTGVATIQDYVTVEFFRDEFINDNLEKAEFFFETQNTINRSFELQIDFLDSLGVSQHTITITEDAAPDNTDTITTNVEVFEDDDLEVLKSTKILVFTLRLLAGEAIDEETLGRIMCQSYVAFYMNITY